MNAVIISYIPGMFGEFFSSLLESSDSRFFSNRPISVNDNNRYIYPNYLLPINLDIKNHERSFDTWPITKDHLKTLETVYGDKWICLPTHWIHQHPNYTMLPGIGIRLYCDSIVDNNLSYCMWWLKSHIYANKLWPSRRKEIENMIDNDHRYKDQLNKLLDSNNFHNWIFLSYKRNILNDQNLDLRFYIKSTYYQLLDSKMYHPPFENWIPIDIGKLVNTGDTGNIENKLGLQHSLDKQKIESYKEKNLLLLKEKLNLTYNDLSNEKWLDVLSDYCIDFFNHS
jgi:hypothetical protein